MNCLKLRCYKLDFKGKARQLVECSGEAPLHHHEADVGVRNQGSLEAVALPCLQAPGRLRKSPAAAEGLGV